MTDREHWLQRPPKTALAGRLRAIAWILSAVVLFLVAAMRKIQLPLPEGVDLLWLPPLYSSLNALAAVALVAALIFVKQGKIAAHRACITTALALSLLFLLGYVAYHLTTQPTTFGGTGAIRGIYFFLLITHIVLAAVSFPFILLAFISGASNEFARHRRLVRWVFPVWLYVAITGPVCYLMLRPYYGG
jgi:putative membrane protein